MTEKASITAGLVAALVLAMPSAAQDERPAPPEPAQDTAQDRSPTPSGRPAPDENDDVFIPSEEIGADEEVTFPVDI